MNLTLYKSANNNVNYYLKSISKIKLLAPEEEYNLALEYCTKQNKEAAQQLVVSHLPLVVKVAYSFKGYGIPLMELISEGNIGLMKAVTKFDPYKGYRLSTYAIWWIKAYISDFILNSWSLVKYGTIKSRKKLFFSLKRIKKQLFLENKILSDDDIKQIAHETNLTSRDVIDINAMVSNKDYYLDAPVYEGDSGKNINFSNMLQDESHTPEEAYASKEQETNIKTLIKEVFTLLNDREKEILKYRYLLEKPLSLAEVGAKLNISRERVRQIEAKALARAKDFLKDKAISII